MGGLLLGYTAPVPLLAIGLLVLLIFASVGLWLTLTVTHLLLTLAVAGFVGWLADLVVPGELPYGWLGAVAAGAIGGWVGQIILGRAGPSLFGVYLVPTFVGAVILAALFRLLGKSASERA